MKILVVDDEPGIRLALQALLESSGFEVVEAEDGRVGLRLVHEERPDLVVLDVAMPVLDGWKTLERIRDMSDVPVLMLTAHCQELEKVRGLLSGADDYLTKPFGNQELLARVKVLLKRAARRPAVREVRVVGGLEVDVSRRQVTKAGEPVELTRIEFDLLDALTSSPKLVLSRAQLMEHVWGPGWNGDDHKVDVHISNLRRKLGDDPRAPRCIETVRGVGFRLAGTAQG
jgi:DNA-binding response OmpR family regulator